jgi:hypothetical protein
MEQNPVKTCPITRKNTFDSIVLEDFYEYKVECNKRNFTLRWSISFDGGPEHFDIKKEDKQILEAMLYNNEWPIETETIITKHLVSQIIRIGEYPRNFDEKLNYYLLKSFENGGSEYKTISVEIENYLSTYAKDADEYIRLINALKSKELISTKEDRISDFTLTEKGLEFAAHLLQIKTNADPKRYEAKTPSIIVVGIKKDEPFIQRLIDDLLDLGAQVIHRTILEPVEDTFFSSVEGLRNEIYSAQNSYIIFVKSNQSNWDQSYGSLFDIAIEVHLGTEKSKNDFIYIAAIDDSFSKGRPRLSDYVNTTYDFRIVTNRKRSI